MNKTKIEYLDCTWNPLAMLCDPVSAGCQHCWHRRRAKMLANNPLIPKDQQDAYAGRSHPILIHSRLVKPGRCQKSAIIGAQFMGDLFHENVPFDSLRKILFSIYTEPQHKFLILTKRPKRMASLLNQIYSKYYDNIFLPNVWLGVSVEDRENLWRVDELLKIPATIRFISFEPLLGEINLEHRWINHPVSSIDFLQRVGYEHPNYHQARPIDWIITGPETGPGARPCPDGAIENLYEQCMAAGVPFFDKRQSYLAREFPFQSKINNQRSTIQR